MLGLSANLNYYLFNGNVDLRKGIFRLCESIKGRDSLTDCNYARLRGVIPSEQNYHGFELFF